MKPILFNTEMVRTILDGRKTQTRRVVKGPPSHALRVPSPYPWTAWETDDEMWHIKPPFFPGDILYVRETWATKPSSSCKMAETSVCPYEGCKNPPGPCFDDIYIYKATDSLPQGLNMKWHPSIHMPKEAARIFLRVTSVRAERLQKSFFEPISPIFAVQSEGIDIGEQCRACIDAYGYPCCVDEMDDDGTTHGECGMLDDPRYEFSKLWDSTIKPADLPIYGWPANPWVWVIEFERCEKPEEQA